MAAVGTALRRLNHKSDERRTLRLLQQLTKEPNVYYMDADQIESLDTLLAVWQTTYSEATAAKDAARAATQAKNEARAALTKVVRGTSGIIQADTRVPDSAKADAGLKIHKTTHTPVPVPTTSPVGFVIASDRLEHTLTYHDAATPTRRARPAGVNGCEVYVYVGDDVPQRPLAYRFHSFSTRTPDRVKFHGDDAGKLANYLLRWVNTRGEVGPWSQVVSATVPAV